MFINNKLSRLYQQRIQKRTKNVDSYEFFNLLTRPELLKTVEELLPEHRERHYPPMETLSMFLAQALSEDGSCQKVVNDTAIQRMSAGLPSVSTATGAYCRARQRLPQAIVSSLVHRTAELINLQIPSQWRWQGRRVHLIDGTTVTMPDTANNQAVYPQQNCQKLGLGFPICRLVGIICLASGAILNASIGPYNGKGADEQTLLRKMLSNFEKGDLILGDALFGTYFLLASLQAKGIDAVFEQMGARKRVTDFRKGKRLGSQDHLVKLSKPKKKPHWMDQEDYENAPDTLMIRELKINNKVLITTLLSPKKASKLELKSLYKKRWQIEVDFRNIKTTMGMERLSCKSPEMNEKEIWVYFLAYNLIRLLMAQAALLADILPRQLSFKHTLQLWLVWSQQSHVIDEDQSKKVFFMLIAQRRIGNRTGRIEPRAVKRRPKSFPLLMKPRKEAREDVRKNGHPKKIK